METATTTATFRRLKPDAPVGLHHGACLPLRSRYAECDRCIGACPVGVLHRSEQSFSLDEGCLGCGRCAAVCPMGAITVPGFALRPTEIKATRTLALDCWKVPTSASPQRAVRVPCLGGLSPGQLLGLAWAARGRGVELLDRGWCGACAANPGAAHPAASALAAVRGWLAEARVPQEQGPRLVNVPLPTTRAVVPDPRNEMPVSRRHFFSALARASVSLASATLGSPHLEDEPTTVARAPVASSERERVLVFLAALAAEHGSAVPVSLYPAVAIGTGCRNHRLCAALCPTGALRAYESVNASGVAFDAAACIACGQCETVCPEKAIRLLPAGNATIAAGAAVLSRHLQRSCANCGAEFTDPVDRDLCPVCRQSRDFASASFNQLFRSAD